MTLERGRRASSVDRAIDGWRKDAQRWRLMAFDQRQAIGTARSLIAKALEILEDPDRPYDRDVHLHLLDALTTLDNTDERKQP